MKPVCRIHKRPLYFVSRNNRPGEVGYTVWVCPDERHPGDLYRVGTRKP